MSKKIGLSLEEQRAKMLQIFYDSQEYFFLVKELKKLGPEKGVFMVKDVVQSLVDDELVFKDKIGSSVYYWILAKDELDSELKELEGAELEVEFLRPATTAPAAPVRVPAGRDPTRPTPQKWTEVEEELAPLQAEKAL